MLGAIVQRILEQFYWHTELCSDNTENQQTEETYSSRVCAGMRDGRKLTVQNWRRVRWNLSGYLWPGVLININSVINLRPCYSRSPTNAAIRCPAGWCIRPVVPINTSTTQLIKLSKDFNCFLSFKTSKLFLFKAFCWYIWINQQETITVQAIINKTFY